MEGKAVNILTCDTITLAFIAEGGPLARRHYSWRQIATAKKRLEEIRDLDAAEARAGTA